MLDGIIILIVDFFGCCLDVVGVGGWFFNDVMLFVDVLEVGDFIVVLRFEVIVVLEGVEEVVFFNGIVGEVV